MASANIDECPIVNHESDSDETKSSKSVGVSFYTVLQILESLFLVGMNSLENWEVVINGLKSMRDSTSTRSYTQFPNFPLMSRPTVSKFAFTPQSSAVAQADDSPI
ncbi:hypothetical protein J6590_096482 [Homalodisca vitripennis]|nr:hypothetical protein J6590_096482 [Homalodisca vitripennis]